MLLASGTERSRYSALTALDCIVLCYRMTSTAKHFPVDQYLSLKLRADCDANLSPVGLHRPQSASNHENGVGQRSSSTVLSDGASVEINCNGTKYP